VKKIAQNVAQPIFVKINTSTTYTLVKSSQIIWQFQKLPKLNIRPLCEISATLAKINRLRQRRSNKWLVHDDNYCNLQQQHFKADLD
jgi:hypothetical protein